MDKGLFWRTGSENVTLLARKKPCFGFLSLGLEGKPIELRIRPLYVPSHLFKKICFFCNYCEEKKAEDFLLKVLVKLVADQRWGISGKQNRRRWGKSATHTDQSINQSKFLKTFWKSTINTNALLIV